MTSIQQPSNGRLRPIHTSQILKPSPSDRKQSESSDSSSSSQVTMLSVARPASSPYGNPAIAASTSSLSSAPRMALPPRKSSRDVVLGRASPVLPLPQPDYRRHRARQHSQGFFEPSLRTYTSSVTSPTAYTASALAAQAAMHVQPPQHIRRRSQTIPDPAPMGPPAGRRKPSYPSPIQTQLPAIASTNGGSAQARPLPQSGTRPTAATAAAAAYPRSPLYSPDPPYLDQSLPASPEKLNKEKSRMKLFSKPKALNIAKDKDGERRGGALSPNKMGIYGPGLMSRSVNHSTTSLVDSTLSSASSLYSSGNASTSTLVPSERGVSVEREKHRHNFLSRQRNKLGDHYNLPLSSASSNSRPADPNAPQSLYSFAPSSPGPGSTFNKSISGLDLRHGGRALREKKREEKDFGLRDRDNLNSNSDWLGPATAGASSTFGPASSAGIFTPDAQNLAGFGLPSMASDDAWPLLKARMLNIFEGEDPRTPIEDFNRLVTVHLQFCIQRRAPSVIIEDLRELFHTGFSSLDQTLRRIPDDRLVPHLVDMWSSVFGTVLPFMQAVFLPLDLEFKGRGVVMSPREAADFWGALPIFSKSSAQSSKPTAGPAPGPPTPKTPVSQISLGEALDIRTLVLLAFRDTVILPRNDILLTIFSRLSLDSINGYSSSLDRLSSPHQPPLRPSTAASSGSGGTSDPNGASYNSQSSTLLDSGTLSSLGARSRATSNTSAGSFHSVSSQRPQPGGYHSRTQLQQHHHPAPMDSAQVTQTAARMLQCVSVLAGLQAAGAAVPASAAVGAGSSIAEEAEGEEEDGEDGEVVARRKMARLAKELKLNWLGRGRTGRNRKGFVGTKVRSPVGLGMGVGVGA